MNQQLDASLAQFAGRPLAEAFPYLILDARYAGTGGRDPRKLARAASLPQHGRSARAQEGGTATCGLSPDPFSLAACAPPPAVAYGQS
jgi:hypothetical protein